MKKTIAKRAPTKIKKSITVADTLYERIASIVRAARTNIVRTIDTTMVKAYWHIGNYIVEEEQGGVKRAGYGTEQLKAISARLTHEFGNGFGVKTLENSRKFYLTYSVAVGNKKSYTLRRKLDAPKFSPNLSWSHYRALMRISRPEARQFYEIEAAKNRWSARQLERQINTLLYDRLAKSKDKAGLLKLVNQDHEITKPEDAIKDPFVLEFLNIESLSSNILSTCQPSI